MAVQNYAVSLAAASGDPAATGLLITRVQSISRFTDGGPAFSYLGYFPDVVIPSVYPAAAKSTTFPVRP